MNGVRPINLQAELFRAALLGLTVLLIAGGCRSQAAPTPASTATSVLTVAPTSQPVSPVQQGVTPSASPQGQPTTAATASRLQALAVGALTSSISTSEYMTGYQNWTRRLGEVAGISLTLRADFPTELALLEAMRDGEVALAPLTSWAYVYGHERGWVQPGMMDLTYDGQEGQAISLFARADSGLAPGTLPDVLQQLRGRRPCYLKRNSNLIWLPPVAEYILPSGLLARNGVAVEAPLLLEGQGASAVEVAAFRQECDFGAEDALPPTGFQNRLPGGLGGVSFEQFGRQMQVLFTTDRIKPSGLFAFSSALPAAQREALNNSLPAAGYPYSSPWKDYELRMAPFNEQLFGQYAQIVAASGVNLEDYIGPAGLPQPATVTPPARGWTPAPPGTLVVDVDTSGDRSFIPCASAATALQRLVLPAIHAELARLDASGNYFPYLAAGLPSLQNGLARFVGTGEDQHLEVEFVLRPGLTWQDGYPLTADDLVFSWELVTDPRWPGDHYGQAGAAAEVYVAGAAALAPDRVAYRFMSQRQAREAARTGGRLRDPRRYADLAGQVGPVVPLDYLEVGRNVFPRHLLQGVSPVEVATGAFAANPVYAGPYRLVGGGEAEGSPVILEAFAGFALGQPGIRRVVFGATYSNPAGGSGWQAPAELAQALRAGAVHAQLGRSFVNIRQGEDLAGYDALATRNAGQVLWADSSLWEVLDFNLDNPHLADLRVRQAIAYALDRQTLIDQVLDGHGSLMRTYLSSQHPLYAGDSALPAYAHDPTTARSLLREAGYDLSQGTAVHPARGPLILQLHSMDVAPYPRPPIAALIQQQLAEVGIRVEVVFHPWPDFEGKDCTAIRNGRRFDLGLAGYLGSGEAIPIVWVEDSALSSSIPGSENGCGQDKFNWPGWRSAPADAVYAQLREGRLALQSPQEYRSLWAEHQHLWATDLPSLPLFTYQRPIVTVPALIGVQPPAYGIGGVEDTWNVHEWALK